jgi:hypothetical protein
VVTCPLAPSVPHLLSGSCSSPRAFGLGFLQTPPHDDALALLLAFGSANTWHEDLHLASSVPCPAHTLAVSGGPQKTTTRRAKTRTLWAVSSERLLAQDLFVLDIMIPPRVST